MRRGSSIASQSPRAASKYRLLAELGHGGMADLYLAVSRGPAGFSKLLVIKRLRNAGDPHFVTMFLDEARLAARLNHPNIVQTFEVAEEEILDDVGVGVGAGAHFMVMEFLDGPTLHRLRRRAARHGGVPVAIELEIMCNVLEGLHHAHELRTYDGRPLDVVHRDLSPQNVMITQQGECKVLDFGIAKSGDSSSQTEAGLYKGKLKNMPPEQLRGELIDRRVDVFAAGVMLWEGLSGQPLWGDQPGSTVAYRLIQREIPPLGDLPPGVPRELRDICVRALAPMAADRPSTALELKGELTAVMRRHGMVVSRAELAAFVDAFHGPERERLRLIVESQLTAPTDSSTLGAAPVPLPRADGSTGAGRTEHRPTLPLTVVDGVPRLVGTTGGRAPWWRAAALAVCGVAVLAAGALAMHGMLQPRETSPAAQAPLEPRLTLPGPTITELTPEVPPAVDPPAGATAEQRQPRVRRARATVATKVTTKASARSGARARRHGARDIDRDSPWQSLGGTPATEARE